MKTTAQILASITGTANCGLNADWSLSAFRVYPPGRPNHDPGYYLIENEDDSASLVFRDHAEDNDDYTLIYEWAEATWLQGEDLSSIRIRCMTCRRVCPDCGGAGRISSQSHDAEGTVTHRTPCAPCHGEGSVEWDDRLSPRTAASTPPAAALTPPCTADTADAAMTSTKLIEFSRAVLSLLTTPEWDAGLLDDIAAEAYSRNLAHSGEDDTFTLS